MAEEKSGGPRKRFNWSKFTVEVLLGILIPVALLGTAKLYIGRRARALKVMEPPQAMRDLVKACGVEAPAPAARQAPANVGGAAARGGRQAAEDLQSIKSYEDYLRRRVRLNPRDEAARLYLEFAELAQAEPFKKDFQAAFSKDDDTSWPLVRPGSPLDEAEAAWVRAHGRELGLIEQLSQTSGSLELTPGDRMEVLAGLGLGNLLCFFGRTDVCNAAVALLTSNARIHLAQGRPEAAQQDYLRLLALADKTPSEISIFYLNAFIGNVTGWINNQAAPAPEWRRFIPPLDDYCQCKLMRERLRGELAATYLGARDYWARRQGWRKTFSEQGADYPLHPAIYLGPIQIPDPRPRIKRAMTEVFYEERVPHWVERFDRQCQAILERAARPWPEASRIKMDEDEDKTNLLAICSHLMSWSHDQALSNEAKANVLRAALRLMSGEGAGAAERSAEAVRKDPHSPWRDPFTEAPLRVVEETTQTLIYSLGPDLIDQQGKVEYGQKSRNGEDFDAGDIILRIPRAKK